MPKEKKPLTFERVVEGLYGIKPQERKYTSEELAQYRKRLQEYARKKAAPENARAQLAKLFTDYDAYISELDAIMDGAKDRRMDGDSPKGLPT